MSFRHIAMQYRGIPITYGYITNPDKRWGDTVGGFLVNFPRKASDVDPENPFDMTSVDPYVAHQLGEAVDRTLAGLKNKIDEAIDGTEARRLTEPVRAVLLWSGQYGYGRIGTDYIGESDAYRLAIVEIELALEEHRPARVKFIETADGGEAPRLWKLYPKGDYSADETVPYLTVEQPALFPMDALDILKESVEQMKSAVGIAEQLKGNLERLRPHETILALNGRHGYSSVPLLKGAFSYDYSNKLAELLNPYQR